FQGLSLAIRTDLTAHQYAAPSEDGCDGCTQLMTDGRQKIVLRAACLFCLQSRFLRLPQCFALSTLGALLLRDVPRNVRNTNHLSKAVANWRDCLRYLKTPPIFSYPRGFIMLHALSTPYTRQDLWFFVGMGLWNQDCDRFTDDLGGGIAKEHFRTVVPSRHSTIQILADNCIFGRFDKCAEERFRHFRLLPAFPLRDVAGDLRGPYDPADTVANRCNRY